MGPEAEDAPWRPYQGRGRYPAHETDRVCLPLTEAGTAFWGYRDTGSRSTTRGQRSIVIVEHPELRAALSDTLPSVLSSPVAPVTAIVAENSFAEAKCARRKISIVS